jgi:endonuclease/exonuclease/phosphatase family metal-dependent hydrolase
MFAGRGAPNEQNAATIAAFDADIVIQQEDDDEVQRTGWIDQPAVLGATLGYDYAFAVTTPWDGGDIGLLTLSRLPFAAVKRISLDPAATSEPRIGLLTVVCAGARPVPVVNHHADIFPGPALDNMRELLDALAGDRNGGLILGGDLNQEPDAAVPAAVATAGLVDAVAPLDSRPTRGNARIDYLFADPPLAALATRAEVLVDTDGSDHRPVIADFDLSATP